MRPREGSSSLGEKVEDLQRRYQLLAGEKRSNEESAAVQVRANKEAIRRLSETNNKLRSEISLKSSSEVVNASNQSSSIEESIKLKNKFNAVRSENMRKEQLIEQLKKQLEMLSSKSLAEEACDTSDRRVRVLENRIDKAMIKYNEAQSIKKTYEGILHRLKEERVGFDRELLDLEKQLEEKKKDYQELLLLSHDAVHAKEMAQAELHRFEQAVLEERNQRDREVMEKKLLVQQRIEMNSRLERKEKEAAAVQMNSSITSGPVKTCEDTMKDPPVSVTTSRSVNDAVHRTQQRLHEYEEAYSKLKEVTGVSDVNEIIQKFISQETTYSNLVKLSQDQQNRLQILSEEHDKLKLQLDEAKFSASSSGGQSLKIGNDESLAESLVTDSLSKLEKNRTRYETLAKILVQVNAGVGHLHEKLACIQLDDVPRPLSSPPPLVVLSNETIEEVLNVCELKICKIIERAAETDSIPSIDVVPDNFVPDIRIRGPGDRVSNVEDVDFDASSPGNGTENDVFNRKLFKSNSELFVKKYVLTEFKCIVNIS